VCTVSSSANAPYGSVNGKFIGYDDQESIVYKVNNIMKKYSMKGYMFWALDLDDFSGRVCNQGRYPLMNAAKKASVGDSINLPNCRNVNTCGTPPSTTKSPTIPTDPTGTTAPTTKSPVVVTGKCKSAGPWEGSAGMDQWCNLEQNCRIACTKPCPNQAICYVSVFIFHRIIYFFFDKCYCPRRRNAA